MLRNRSRSTLDIAALGFGDASYLSQVFRRTSGRHEPLPRWAITVGVAADPGFGRNTPIISRSDEHRARSTIDSGASEHGTKISLVRLHTVVKALQERYGRRRQYAKLEKAAGSTDRLGPEESSFIAERDSFYMASIGATGWCGRTLGGV
jgi:hypothetical protein